MTSSTSRHAQIVYKLADQPWELERIHELNYKTFVEEIPQHRPNEERALVDKFHAENSYIIAVADNDDGEKDLIGMVAARGRRPFSLDHKLENLDEYLVPGRRYMEARLLSVEPGKRNTRIAVKLLTEIMKWAVSEGYEGALISGTTRQLKLYHRMGFEAFGPLLGDDPSAQYQPMKLEIEKLAEKAEEFSGIIGDDVKQFAVAHFQSYFDKRDDKAAGESAAPSATIAEAPKKVTLLPGPVNIRPSVTEAFKKAPVSHRAEFFVEAFQEMKRSLCEFVQAERVEVLVGTGTMANDVIGGQIKLVDAPGLVLANGEFGERLVDHATRFELSFDVYREAWGRPFDLEQVEAALKSRPNVGWIWCTHCETSTGVLNPLEDLKVLCARYGVKLFIDGVSSIAAVPVNLQGVYMCSGSSGKAIGGFPGLSMVFYHHDVQPSNRLPRYLDLGQYAKNNGIAYTHSSNLVYALKEAVDSQGGGLERVAELSGWVRDRVEEMGFEVVAPREHASPAVLSIVIPEGSSSKEVGDRAYENGYLLSYMSGYLLERNWVQVCLMGDVPQLDIQPLLDVLAAYAPAPGRSTARPAA